MLKSMRPAAALAVGVCLGGALVAFPALTPAAFAASASASAPAASAAERTSNHAGIDPVIDGVSFRREIEEERLLRYRGDSAPGEYVVAFEEGFEPGRLAEALSRDAAVERGRVWGEQPGGAFRGIVSRS